MRIFRRILAALVAFVGGFVLVSGLPGVSAAEKKAPTVELTGRGTRTWRPFGLVLIGYVSQRKAETYKALIEVQKPDGSWSLRATQIVEPPEADSSFSFEIGPFEPGIQRVRARLAVNGSTPLTFSNELTVTLL